MTTLIKKQTVIPVTELEQSAFCQAEGNLRTKTLKEEFLTGVRWQKVPKRYLTLEPSEIDEGILYCKKQLGESVVILGHHYQRDEVIKHADITGDSFKLSKVASEYDRSKWIRMNRSLSLSSRHLSLILISLSLRIPSMSVVRPS